jgi:HPt (histidine-containing phosphotransfer) domain-containing protein
LQEGFVDYLSKPVDYLKLESLLVSYIDKAKIQKVEEKASPEQKEDDAEAKPSEYAVPNEVSVADKIFFANCCKTAGMDARAAIANCGDFDVLKTVIAEYYRTIEEKSNLIELYKNNRDWKNYTVQVHALKSSSRLIGAMELSRLAAYLEQCGDKKIITEIENKTPDLLKLYRSYKLNLKLVADMASDSDQEFQEKEEPKSAPVEEKEIPQEPTQIFDEATYKGVVEALKEYAQSADFDSIKNVIGELKAYKIPESKKNFFAEILEAANKESLDSLSNILIDE